MHKKKILVTLQVAFTYIGALVGAGFASGQESLQFFTVFGANGIIGAVFSGLLFGLFGLLVIKITSREKMSNYGQLLQYLFGRKASVILEVLLSFFFLLCLVIMLVAGGSLFHQLWDFPFSLGFFLTALVICVTLLVGTEGVLWLNTALIPGLIILSLVIAFFNLSNQELVVAAFSELNLVGENWLLATCLYVSYNFILSAAILSALGHTAKEGGQSGVLLGGMLFGLMAGVISVSLLNQKSAAIQQEIPMLVLAYNMHPLMGWVYSFVLWIAILSTALSVSFGLLKRLEQLFSWPKLILILLIFVPTLPFIYFSFPRMVVTIYPLIGYSGFVFLCVLLAKTLPRKLILSRWRR